MDEVKNIRPCSVILGCTVVEFVLNPNSPISYINEVHSMSIHHEVNIPSLRNPYDDMTPEELAKMDESLKDVPDHLYNERCEEGCCD